MYLLTQTQSFNAKIYNDEGFHLELKSVKPFKTFFAVKPQYFKGQFQMTSSYTCNKRQIETLSCCWPLHNACCTSLPIITSTNKFQIFPQGNSGLNIFTYSKAQDISFIQMAISKKHNDKKLVQVSWQIQMGL